MGMISFPFFMTARNSKDTFIQKANNIHINKYDYSLADYINSHTKLTIICSIHGEFQQTPVNHITNKQGCPKCRNDKVKQTNLERYGVDNPTKNPIIRQKQLNTKQSKYGDKYYTNLEKSKKTNLEKYGVEFPLQNLDILNQTRLSLFTTYGVEFPTQSPEIQEKIKQANLKIYGVEFPFQNSKIREKIIQTCISKYGVEYITQVPEIREKIKQTNLERYGVEYPLQNIDVYKKINLEKYGVKHNNQRHMVNILPLIEDYDWLFDQYIIQNKTALQISKDLGINDTTVGNYLKKFEIEIKYTYSYSYACINWLESIMEHEGIYIQHALNEGEYLIPGTRYKADGYCQDTNTVYEFYGDYWHGNPDIYEADVINESNNCTMGELYQNTIKREDILKNMGYRIVSIWESTHNLK